MNAPLRLTDLEPAVGNVRASVMAGLRNSPKTLPTAFLYDERGSDLFEQITELPEYYPTRTERKIMDRFVPEIATHIGPEALVIEYGSGAGVKTRKFLAALESPVAYVPVEISREFLMRSAAELASEFPNLEVLPVCADFTQPVRHPEPATEPRRRVLYFPGSTIGNFERSMAVRLLSQMRELVGPNGAALLGIDLRKDRAVLEAAYNDSAGVTAQFNLNLLSRANEELGADFDVSGFRHRAVWVEERGAIEMRLIAIRDQVVQLGGETFTFAEGEWIHTEDSRKYEPADFANLAREAGFKREAIWTDDDQLFSIQLFAAC